MKTAMQELKDLFMEAGTLADWMDDAFDEYTEKEERQIIDAFNAGDMNFTTYVMGKDYYNKTFKL